MNSSLFLLGLFGAAILSAAAPSTKPQIVTSTYLGGDGRDSATDVAVDPQGNVYVLGTTAFGTLDPGTVPLIRHLPKSPFEGQPGVPPGFFMDTGADVFVVKFAADLKTVTYFAAVGGSGNDQAVAIDTDAQGNAVILFRTESLDLPTRNPIQPNLRGDSDLAVVKLSSDGQTLIFSTYLGGDFHEIWISGGADLALDKLGQIYLAGTTFSANFPVTNGGFQPQPGSGTPNGFVTKLSADGQLIYSTYLGGNGNDEGHAIAVDADGNAYIGGRTTSTNFPLVRPINGQRGVAEGTAAAGQLFLAKMNPSGSALDFSTFLIGDGLINSIALTPQRGLIVVGTSTGGLTTTPNALQRAVSGGFALELNPEFSAVVFATHLGGNSVPHRVAVDPTGNMALTGAATSGSLITTHSGLPSFNPAGSSADAFVVKFGPDRSLTYSIRLGGGDADEGRGIAFLPNGHLLLVGATRSLDYPLVTAVRGNPISDEGFVTQITEVPDNGDGPGNIPGETPRVTQRYSDRESANIPKRFYRIRQLRP